MTPNDEFDQIANARARQYIGPVAWPTVILGLAAGMSYIVTVSLTLSCNLSLWLAVPLVALFTYLNYTVFHESVHGSISGNHPSLRWINEALGYLSAWILMIPLTAHRHEHMAHHRHTNDEVNDPDFHVGQMRDSLPAAVRAVWRAFFNQFSYYYKKRWTQAPARQNLYFCLEMAAALIPRLAVLLAGYWAEGLTLFVLAWLIGAIALLYLFACVVHQPHARMGRYLDTSTILLSGPLNRLLTNLWMYQNYHSIHHLFPRVPFYKYAKLYNDIEAIMATKGAPVYRMTLRGLEPLPPGLAA